MLDIIEKFYEEHPILFDIIVVPIELFIGIPTGILIANTLIRLFCM